MQVSQAQGSTRDTVGREENLHKLDPLDETLDLERTAEPLPINCQPQRFVLAALPQLMLLLQLLLS